MLNKNEFMARYWIHLNYLKRHACQPKLPERHLKFFLRIGVKKKSDIRSTTKRIFRRITLAIDKEPPTTMSCVQLDTMQNEMGKSSLPKEAKPKKGG